MGPTGSYGERGKLHNLYSSKIIIRMVTSRRIRLVGHIARMGKKRNACRLLVGKPGEGRSLERRRSLINIKMGLRLI
jgi:hypothetical protein